jgi:hypothetical protein
MGLVKPTLKYTPKPPIPPKTPQTLVSHILGSPPPKYPLVHLAYLSNKKGKNPINNTASSTSIKAYYLSYIYIYTIKGGINKRPRPHIPPI